jgi:hypothetical protein
MSAGGGFGGTSVGGSGSGTGGRTTTPPKSGGGFGSDGGAGSGTGSATVTNPDYLDSLNDRGGGSTLGAALLNLDTQESAPGGAGGLDLYARQQREINRLKSRVAVVEQVLVV